MATKTIVLVSGGNAGIGYEIVKKLASDHSSTHHILMGTRSILKGEEAKKSMGSPSNVTPVQLDITKDASINELYNSIESDFGKLDILINNAGTAGQDLGQRKPGEFRPESVSTRELYSHVYNVNIVSTAVLTENMVPLLTKSDFAKIVFVSSCLGSVGWLLSERMPPLHCEWYSSSKAALNYLAAFYAKLYPDWKVNAVCPGENATELNQVSLSDDTHPRNGAIRVCELVAEGKDGSTGTYSDRNGKIDW